MAEENDAVMAEVMNMLEVEPAVSLPAPGPDIPTLREQLAILVFTGKCKECKCKCIHNWPLPIGAFQDQCKQI